MAAEKRKTKSKPRSVIRSPILQLLPDGILVLDATGRITDLNPAAAGMTGVSEKAALGKDIREVFAAWTEWERIGSADAEQPALAASPRNPEQTLEIRRFRIPPGRGKKTGGLILLRDVSDRIRMEQEHKRSMELMISKNSEIQALSASLRDQAIRDPLTNLYNRTYMSETLDRELARAARLGNPISVLQIRLDRFGNADEIYGEKAGVELVKIMSSLLIRYVRRGDLACRYGVDEFVVVLPGARPVVAGSRAEQLREAFHESILNFLGSRIECTFSCGVASYPNQGTTAEVLLDAAGSALQASIDGGGNKVTVSG
jgi:diguanylate cyclase (GGDEF)-like protein/PAS domain S-box-containing protein